MADATGKKLWSLLKPGHPPEVRNAAALVVGELGGREPELAQTLLGLLDDPDPLFRGQVVKAVGKLRIDKALPRLLDKVRAGGPESELAAEAAARLGAKGITSLQNLMGEVAPGLRRRIAGSLALGDTASAESAAVDALLDTDPNVVDAAARTLLAKTPSLEAKHRRALVDHVLALVKGSRKSGLAPASETALLRLLAGLGDERAEPLFWERLEASHPPELRAAALQALGTLGNPSGRDKIQQLLACAGDPDFRVAAPALMMLKSAPVADRNLADWLPLFDSPDPAVRRFAIEKLADRDRPEIAPALVNQVNHPDRGLREEALKRLGASAKGREALARAVLEEESPDKTWALAKAQAPFIRDYPPGLRTKLFAKASAFLEEGDRRADALLFLLREADAPGLRDQLADRAVAVRKKGDYARALVYLRLLARDPACGDPIRFELAACGLKTSPHDPAPDKRSADPSLEQFAGLVRRKAIDPLAAVEKAKWLEAEDLFYLGFHFIEGTKEEKEFGADVLRLLLKRWPRAKIAKDAKNKLKSAGLK